jgi:hypothetical protein
MGLMSFQVRKMAFEVRCIAFQMTLMPFETRCIRLKLRKAAAKRPVVDIKAIITEIKNLWILTDRAISVILIIMN